MLGALAAQREAVLTAIMREPSCVSGEAVAMDTPMTHGSVSLLMVEFLTWMTRRPRSYAEVMEAWRSTCPRQSVWEDALADGLVQLESDGTLDHSRVTVTARGSTVLDAQA